VNMPTLPQILETLLFTAGKPLSRAELITLIERGREAAGLEQTSDLEVSEQALEGALEELADQLKGRPLCLQEVNKGYRLATRPEVQWWAALPHEAPSRPSRLSQAALETLAVIAYRQPISRAEIEAVRGVAAGGVLETLVDRGVVRVAGRAEVPGRPLLYETTSRFLEHFGLNDIEDLPNGEELKRVPLPQPPDPEKPTQQELIQNPHEEDTPPDS